MEEWSAALVLPGRAIRSFAPEKVLAVRQDWAETELSLVFRLIRAVWQAGRWLSQGGAISLAAEMLGRPAYLNLSPELLERGLRGRLVVSPWGEERDVPQFIDFHAGAANFLWRSQAQWIADRLARRTGLDQVAAQAAAATVFRPDLFRQALGKTGTDLSGASVKLEGALKGTTPVASAEGRVVLCRDAFSMVRFLSLYS